ncbi:hypothetical protein FACS1894127_7680 [Clostridia bacterium]|nr:hypothetical protein FACS1894127_7680 [Clostridia bacterium]
MSELFNVEETNLMCIFDTSSRENLIYGILTAMSDFDEPELIELAENVVIKISAIGDDEFVALDLHPVYDDYDESE